MGNSKALVACSLILLCWLGTAVADPFAGRFVGEFNGEEYRLALHSTGNGQYEGVIVIGGKDVPLIALRQGDRLLGQVGIGGDSFDFSADLRGELLLLEDDSGAIIEFSRE
jgi:hypothetical protein